MIIDILFSALRTSLMGQPLDEVLYSNLTDEQWEELFRLSAQQGVCAIVYNVISQLPKEIQPPKNLHIQWILSTENIENRYNLQRKIATELAQLYADNGIKTVVLKGLAISSYYPIPNHRECGDLDCFLGDDYERGNVIAEQNGAKVERDYYKHSHIHYKGLMIENHQFCIAIRGNKRLKQLERHLEKLISDTMQYNYFENTKLIVPPADFNALFLTKHSFEHFLSEGIKLRHVYDWVLLLKKEQENIDWKTFYEICDGLHLTRFVNTLNHIAVNNLGLKLTHSAIGVEEEYSDIILNDILTGSKDLYTQKHKTVWHQRVELVKNRFSFTWKYHKIYRKSVILESLKSTALIFFEPNPKL